MTIVSTARPELGEQRPGWSTFSSSSRSSDETGELVEALLGTTPPFGRREELLARAAGNPLYAESSSAAPGAGDDEERLCRKRSGARRRAAGHLHPEARRFAGRGGDRHRLLGRCPGASAAATSRSAKARAQWKELVRRPRTSRGREQYAFWHVLIRDVPRADPRAARTRLPGGAAWIDRWLRARGPRRSCSRTTTRRRSVCSSPSGDR